MARWVVSHAPTLQEILADDPITNHIGLDKELGETFVPNQGVFSISLPRSGPAAISAVTMHVIGQYQLHDASASLSMTYIRLAKVRIAMGTPCKLICLSTAPFSIATAGMP